MESKLDHGEKSIERPGIQTFELSGKLVPRFDGSILRGKRQLRGASQLTFDKSFEMVRHIVAFRVHVHENVLRFQEKVRSGLLLFNMVLFINVFILL